MLYVTTRNNRDAFTAQRVLGEGRGADGGFYLPFHAPGFTAEDLDRLNRMPFNQRIAEVLNLLFQTKLTGWDVDFSIGRCPVKLEPLRQRIIMGEFWHNPNWNFHRMESNLAQLLRKDTDEPGNWLRIAVRIAVLFAAFGELHSSGIETADVAVVSGDFLWPISAWYARQWGLPVGNIVICCNENQNLWELICHGQMRTDTLSIPTEIPEADIPVPADLERLIYGCGGIEAVERYLDCCRRGASYCVSEPELSVLRKGQYVSVVSSRRIKDTIPGVLRTHGYLLSPGTALGYAGMLDYRAKKGEFRPVLVVSEKSPLCDARIVADILSITPEELKKQL